jgi:hypothetical protein
MYCPLNCGLADCVRGNVEAAAGVSEGFARGPLFAEVTVVALL